MPLPYSFIPGEVARSHEVNENFSYIMDMLGQVSSLGRITPPGEISMGPRQLALLSNKHDTGAAGDRYFQISWNADWNPVPKKGYQFFRVIENAPATAIRIGAQGFVIRSTDKTTGNLDSQMKVRLRAWTTADKPFLYLEPGTRIIDFNEPTTELQKMRLTTVILNRPVVIYNHERVSAGTSTRNAYDYGIPSHAKGIWIRAHVTADNYSGAGMLFYTDNSPSAIIKEKGMVAHATITGSGLGMRTGAFGFVPLGEGAYAGKFRIERTSSFYTAVVHIVGYLT